MPYALKAERGEGGSDYVLREGELGCWITVGNISVHLSRHEEGVIVYLYALHQEMDDELDSAEASFEEARAVIEENASLAAVETGEEGGAK